MTGEDSFSLSLEAAEMYEAKFVPAILSDWAPHLVEAAAIRPGQKVLDVACGTGVVARRVAGQIGAENVVGVDLNDAMLAVAKRVAPEIDWRQADVTELPFPGGSFDAVLCQAALMFFPDRSKAMGEMARVTRPGGTVAVQVWGSLESQPAYSRLVEAAARHVPEAVDLLGSYWVMGDLRLLQGLFEQAGLEVLDIRTRMGTSSFDSIDDIVRAEIEATPLVDMVTKETYEAILRDCRDALKEFEGPGGEASIPLQGHIVAGRQNSSPD